MERAQRHDAAALMTATHRRALVIGAGMGGMATAARLRSQGFEVTVIEQASHSGGKLRAYERDGFVFDLGPSLFTIPAVYRDLFLKTGSALEEVIELQPLEPAFTYHFPDSSTAVIPGVGIQACASALGEALGGDAAAEWKHFMTRAADMWSLTRQSVLHSPIAGVRDMLGAMKSVRDIKVIAPWLTLRKFSQQAFSDERLVMLVDRYATYTGSDPRKAPAVLATVPYVEQEFGAWHIRGGITQLAVALEKRCRERGVIFRFDTDVRSIKVVDNHVTGVELSDGSTLSADVVVSNADAQHVYNDFLSAKVGKSGRRRVRKATKSLSGFVLLVALKGRTPGLNHHNVWFPTNYDEEFDSIFGPSPRPVPDPTIYVCAPNDDLMRPDADSESWFVLINAPRHGDGSDGTFDWSDRDLCDTYAKKILDLLAERGTDVRDRVLWMEWRSPADLAAATRAPGGAIYGTSSNGTSAAFLRAANRSDVRGLYLVGGSSHPGGGLPLVGMSAEIVSDLVKQDFPRG